MDGYIGGWWPREISSSSSFSYTFWIYMNRLGFLLVLLIQPARGPQRQYFLSSKSFFSFVSSSPQTMYSVWPSPSPDWRQKQQNGDGELSVFQVFPLLVGSTLGHEQVSNMSTVLYLDQGLETTLKPGSCKACVESGAWFPAPLWVRPSPGRPLLFAPPFQALPEVDGSGPSPAGSVPLGA